MVIDWRIGINKMNIFYQIKTHKLEIIAVAAAIAVLIMFQWRVIGAKEQMSTHDTLLSYANVYYFWDSLSNGYIPYWDPFTNAGESRFMFWQLGFLLRPTMFIWFFIAKIFHLSLFSVYHLELFTLFVIFCLGCYLFFRKIFDSKISAYIAFIAITFSSLSVVYWWQVSFILTVYILPWILLCALYILEGRKRALIPLAFLVGISVAGIHSMYLIFYCFILIMMLVLTGAITRPNVIILNYKYLILAVLIIILLTAYLLPMLFYKDTLVPFVKIINTPPEQMSENLVRSFGWLYEHSKQLNFFNFFGLFLPQFSSQFFTNALLWMPAQDTVMYVGLIPFILLLIGLIWGSHKYKLGFIFTTIILLFMLQGASSFMMQFAYYFFPKFSWLDYMGLFYGYFMFNLCFFVGLGMDRLIKDAREADSQQFKKYFKIILAMSIFYFVTIGGLLAGVFIFLRKNLGVFLRQKETSGVWLMERMSATYSLAVEMFFYTQFFLLMAALVFYFLKNKDIIFRNKIIFIVFIIIVDLLFINYPVLNYTTNKRLTNVPQYATETKYSDLRLKEVNDFPQALYLYAPALMKQFSAYDPAKNNWPAHLLESESFYAFRTSSTSAPVKNIILGIDAPKLRLLPQAIMAPRDEIIELLEKATIEDINKTAYIEETIPVSYSFLISNNYSTSSKETLTGDIEVLKFDANRLELKVISNQDSFLYYSDGYDKYWTATIDNKPTKIYKTNLAFKSIILPKGEHKVVFLYNPFWFKMGLYSYFFILIAGGLWGAHQLITKNHKFLKQHDTH